MKKLKRSGLIDALNRIFQDNKQNIGKEQIELVVFDKPYFEQNVLGQVDPSSYWYNVYMQVHEDMDLYENEGLEPVVVYNRKTGRLYASSQEAVNGELN